MDSVCKGSPRGARYPALCLHLTTVYVKKEQSGSLGLVAGLALDRPASHLHGLTVGVLHVLDCARRHPHRRRWHVLPVGADVVRLLMQPLHAAWVYHLSPCVRQIYISHKESAAAIKRQHPI